MIKICFRNNFLFPYIYDIMKHFYFLIVKLLKIEILFYILTIFKYAHTIFRLIVLLFQAFYNKVFTSSRLQTHSGIDMTQCSIEGGLNLFLIPSSTKEGKDLFGL